MKQCAILTMDSLENFEAYDHLLALPLAELGWQMHMVSWRAQQVNWDQFDAVMASVRGSPELVALGKDGKDQERFTSADMIAVEERLGLSASMLVTSEQHGVADRNRHAALEGAAERGMILSGEQRDAFDHVTSERGLSSVVGYAGSGKSAMLGVARDAWERKGYNVRGASLSGIAAENLEAGSGITSRTIASLEYQWKHGREQLSERDVLVIDEAGLTGTRQMERVLSAARDAGAKVYQRVEARCGCWLWRLSRFPRHARGASHGRADDYP